MVSEIEAYCVSVCACVRVCTWVQIIFLPEIEINIYSGSDDGLNEWGSAEPGEAEPSPLRRGKAEKQRWGDVTKTMWGRIRNRNKGFCT